MKEADVMKRQEPAVDLSHLPAIGLVPAPADAMADVAAGLSLPPSAGYDVREADKPKAPVGSAAARSVAEVRSGLLWLVHMTLVFAYLGCCAVLCTVMAVWYFESTFTWGTPCCGKQAGFLSDWLFLGKPVSEYLVGVPLWQIGTVVLAIAAVMKILIERAKVRYTPKRGRRRGDELDE